jgi:hypothetical protein
MYALYDKPRASNGKRAEHRTTLNHIRKMSRTLKVSSSAVAKTIERYETGSHEDRDRIGSPRDTSAAEDQFIRRTAPQIAAQINASQSSSNSHILTSTVQRKLCESGLHG